MATTTNYGWTTPDDTDLVKDGAAAIRTLGSSVDTTTKALNPETTTGDIAYRSATANTNTRLALGTAGQVLTVNSGATAPEWATVGGSALNIASIATGTLSGTSFTVSSLTQDTIRIRLIGQNNGSNHRSHLRLNGDSSTVYQYEVGNSRDNYFNTSGGTEFFLSNNTIKSNNTGNCMDITLTSCKATGFTLIEWVGYHNESSSNGNESVFGAGIFKTAGQITSFTVTNAAASWTGGTYDIYGG